MAGQLSHKNETKATSIRTGYFCAGPKVAELVKLRYFAGLTIKQAAEILGVSPRTADQHWAYAKAWLREEIDGN
jgi:DNA-directed RNA polymerase specialized sigma24 family protein